MTSVSSDLFKIQQKVPMEFEYKKDAFYVRDCYDDYYKYIMNLLEGPNFDYISVTGTPGIGKSVFYVYFFHRYRAEHPNTTIITAAFEKDRTLKRCRVFEPSSSSSDFDKIPSIPDALHLYDGPPRPAPFECKMVCFTSPNFAWFDSIRKASNHLALYMPVWSLDELLDASGLLELGFSDVQLRERFQFLGGTARYCLSVEPVFYHNAVSAIEKRIAAIQSFDELKLSLDDRAGDVAYSIFHMVPKFPEYKADLPCTYEYRFSSKCIAEKVFHNIEAITDERRMKFVKWLRGHREASTLIRWLFEGHAIEALSNRWRDFYAFSLMDSLKGDRVSLVQDEYVHVEKYNYPSIDGFCFRKNESKLLMFQVAINPNHPVSGVGIIQHLKKIGLEASAASELEIMLIFVVPGNMIDFKKQQITLPGSDNSASIRTLGIDDVKAKALETQNIRTIAELEAASKNDPKLQKSFKNILDAFSLSRQIEWQFVGEIPQYVILLPGWYIN